jgi:transcriptional regulator with AAA-type ATPase domain
MIRNRRILGEERLQMKKIDWIEQTLQTRYQEEGNGVTSQELAEALQLDRSTVSRYLNELVKTGRAQKKAGRPVRYFPLEPYTDAGGPQRRKSCTGESELLQEAMAALLYPPHGLPILFTGETGVGKTHLAQKLVETAIEKEFLSKKTPFIAFNCAEYAQNPELLLAQLFGVKKGAFTGADENKFGLVERANGGILFLDEIHRLPPSGQEMLFHLIDQGFYRRLGETGVERKADIRLIGATTEAPEKALLPTLLRRFPVRLEILPLRKRPREVREQLLEHFLEAEAKQMGVPLSITARCRSFLLQYDCPGNIGQLKSDIQIACARAFLRNLETDGKKKVTIDFHDLPTYLQPQRPVTSAVKNAIAGGNDGQEGISGNIYRKLTVTKESLLKKKASPAELAEQLQETVNRYVRSLSFQQESRPVDPAIIRVLTRALEEGGANEIGGISDEQLYAIALHIQAWRSNPGSTRIARNELEQVETESVYEHLAQKIAMLLEREHSLRLPPEEIKLISLFLSLNQRPEEQEQPKRLIATVCLTGEGAAVALQSWLEDHLPAEDQDVEIRSVQIDPQTRTSEKLDLLQREFRLIAVAGTVPPELDGVPYIPAWELYQKQGFERLRAILAASRSRMTAENGLTLRPSEIPALIEQGLSETVIHFNPKQFVQLIQTKADTFRRVFSWEPEREIGIWMHLGIYTDQLLAVQLANRRMEKSAGVLQTDLPPDRIKLWEQFLSALSTALHVRYPPSAASEMARLSTTS